MKVENKVIVLSDGQTFLDFIKATHNKVLFTLCNINMAKISGLELKR